MNISTSEVKDLIRNLLQVDVTRRYGCMRSGIQEVKEHRWFIGVDWLAYYLKNVSLYVTIMKLHQYTYYTWQ